MLVKYLQRDVGLSKKAQADAIAEFVRLTVASPTRDGDDAEAASPRTSGSSRGRQITLCVEGNISAGKSTFLAEIIEGSEILKVCTTVLFFSFFLAFAFFFVFSFCALPPVTPAPGQDAFQRLNAARAFTRRKTIKTNAGRGHVDRAGARGQMAERREFRRAATFLGNDDDGAAAAALQHPG